MSRERMKSLYPFFKAVHDPLTHPGLAHSAWGCSCALLRQSGPSQDFWRKVPHKGIAKPQLRPASGAPNTQGHPIDFYPPNSDLSVS